MTYIITLSPIGLAEETTCRDACRPRWAVDAHRQAILRSPRWYGEKYAALE